MKDPKATAPSSPSSELAGGSSERAAAKRVLYIAGDDGEYYRITDADLKSYQVHPASQEIQHLDMLTGLGVGFLGLKLKSEEQLFKQPRFSQAGLFIWPGNTTTHFVNLSVVLEDAAFCPDEKQAQTPAEPAAPPKPK